MCACYGLAAVVTTARLEAGNARLGPTLKQAHCRCGSPQLGAVKLVTKKQIGVACRVAKSAGRKMAKLTRGKSLIYQLAMLVALFYYAKWFIDTIG